MEGMRTASPILLILIICSGCFQSTSASGSITDVRSDLSLDDGDSWEARQDLDDMDDAPDAIDVPVEEDGVLDASGDDDETCEQGVLVLRPVIFTGFVMTSDQFNCEEMGVSEVRILLFQGSTLLQDITLPCWVDEVTVGPVSAGNWELAAVAGYGCPLFVWGINKLRGLYPDLLECSYGGCLPLAFTVPCGTTVLVPLTLLCEENNCPDACGGA